MKNHTAYLSLLASVLFTASVQAAAPKKIVFVAGKKSHGWSAHEHYAGCKFLADKLNENVPDVACTVHREWPEDASALDGIASLVVFCDGGGGNIMARHSAEVDKLAKAGVGIVALHYAVEVPKGPKGELMRYWTGGYFETDWSINPHWKADFKSFPNHPCARGLKPFIIRDEWYYHMRFLPNMDSTTPILSALPPAGTLTRKDGAHSNNPHVRAAVLERKEPQHLGWVRERPDGGRGFGFTGGHFHWNWASDNFRKAVLNAIIWTAKMDVPPNGVESPTPTAAELEKHQDYPRPENWNTAKIQKQIDTWNGVVSK